MENGIAISKLTQVFSKQAPMMDALITHFAEQMRRRRDGTNNQSGENLVEGLSIFFALSINSSNYLTNSSNSCYIFCLSRIEPNPIQNNGCGVLSNKLARLTLATFDDEGQCIGQMGSFNHHSIRN